MYRKTIYIIRLLCLISIPVLIYFDYGWYSVLPFVLSIVVPTIFYILHIYLSWKKLQKMNK